jgi:hypothetical protein
MGNNQLNSPNVFLGEGQGKDKHFSTQKAKVFAALYGQPKTMLMVSIETGILRANICRYVAELRKQNCIFLIQKTICPISKHRAGFYTTNPEIAKSSKHQSNE